MRLDLKESDVTISGDTAYVMTEPMYVINRLEEMWQRGIGTLGYHIIRTQGKYMWCAKDYLLPALKTPADFFLREATEEEVYGQDAFYKIRQLMK
jgi:hypothetical protein